MYDVGILGLYTCLSSVFIKIFIRTFPDILRLLIEQMQELQTLAGVVVVLVQVVKGRTRETLRAGKEAKRNSPKALTLQGNNTQYIEGEILLNTLRCPAQCQGFTYLVILSYTWGN